MSDWPTVQAPVMGTVTPWSWESIGSFMALAAFGLNQVSSSSAWTAQRVVYVPFWLDAPVVVTQLYFYVGATGSAGNADMGIYNADGVLLLSKGSTAVGSAATLQALDVTDTQVGPGMYYLAFWCDSATPTFRRVTPTARFLAALGVWEQGSQSSLPATATFAANSVAIMPVIGFTMQGVL